MLNSIIHHIQYWFNLKISRPFNFRHVLILRKGKEPGHETWSTNLYNTGHVLHPVKTTQMKNLGYQNGGDDFKIYLWMRDSVLYKSMS